MFRARGSLALCCARQFLTWCGYRVAGIEAMIGQTALFAPETTEPLRKRVTIELVTCAYARHTLETYHYLHRTRTGRQLNYAVYIDGQIDGVITYAYPMTSSPIDGVPSDELLEFARLYLHQNIQYHPVIFYMLPYQEIHLLKYHHNLL